MENETEIRPHPADSSTELAGGSVRRLFWFEKEYGSDKPVNIRGKKEGEAYVSQALDDISALTTAVARVLPN
ncbi:hypothetical protein BGX34_000180 [Mortierella sp. NVP85]|nr:hypothetical protein BGX34_000180 [Mortierella sp. NVP85]